jgi:heme/copper-type cytochrome/quinol oxidase subunit 2
MSDCQSSLPQTLWCDLQLQSIYIPHLNQTSMYIKRTGRFFGQCSEICGVNHGFMPIVVDAVSRENYADWINLKLEDLE